MKIILLLAVMSLLITGCQNNTTTEACCSETSNEGLVRHVVVFKFKASATKADIVKVEKAFSALKGEIPLIQDYEWGTNHSTEGFTNDYTHCFIVTFANTADRDAYLPHPAHKKFVSIAVPYLEKPFVIDFTVKLK